MYRGHVLVIDKRVFCHYLDYCEMRFMGSLLSDAIVHNLKVISTSNSCCEWLKIVSCQFNQICFEINKILFHSDYTKFLKYHM